MQHNKPALPWFYSWPGTIFNSLQFAHACVQGIHILNCLMHTYIYILDDCDKNNIQRSGTVVKLNSSKHKQQSRCLLPIVNFSGSLSACCIAKQKRKVCVAYCWTWSKLGARSQRTGLCKVRPLHATPSLAPTSQVPQPTLWSVSQVSWRIWLGANMISATSDEINLLFDKRDPSPHCSGFIFIQTPTWNIDN